VGDGRPLWMAGGFGPGAVIAGYRLEDQIGHGGMAVVFRAHDERLNRRVALKILAPALAADVAFRRRFIRESQAAAAVDDANIIPIFEAGEVGDVLFIAMRLVRGGDVGSMLAEYGPMAPARVEWIISSIGSALDAAHSVGLVHRDVKPGNMLVEMRRGRPHHVYLSDFGLSKASVNTSGLGLTAAGQFLGTVNYSAPEQIQGKAVDGRTDQYALGCTAFELLAGDPPFTRDHPMAALLAHITEVAPLLSSRREGLPLEADAVFAKVLAKNPADRYETCQDFTDALRLALGVHPHDIRELDESNEISDGPGQTIASAEQLDGSLPDEVLVLVSTASEADGRHSDPTTNLRLPREQLEPAQTKDQTSLTPPPPVPGFERPVHRGRRGLAIGVAAVVVLLAGGVGFLLSGSHANTPGVTSISEEFAAQNFHDGVSATRRLTLSGPGGSKLTDRVTLTNSTGTAKRLNYIEPVPTGIVANLSSLYFAPSPEQVIGRDLRWQLTVPAHGSVAVGYYVSVPATGLSKSRLMAWGADLAKLTPASSPSPKAATVKSLAISPHNLKLSVGRHTRLTLKAMLSGGADESVAKATWTSNHAAIAKVNDFGLVSGRAAGVATIMARYSGVSASVKVTVTARGSTSTSTSPASGYTSTSSLYTPPQPSSSYSAPSSSSSAPGGGNPTPTVTPTQLVEPVIRPPGSASSLADQPVITPREARRLAARATRVAEVSKLLRCSATVVLAIMNS
jgi:serine/threonine protein kinase